MVFAEWTEDYINDLIDDREVESINETDERKNTALMWAVKKGNKDLVQKLLESGKIQDIDAYNPNNATALHLAVNSENPEIVRLLVDHHADSCLCINGPSSLMVALETRNEQIINILLDSIPEYNKNKYAIDNCLNKETRVDLNAFASAVRARLPKVLDKMLSMLTTKKIRLRDDTYDIMIRGLSKSSADAIEIIRILLKHNVMTVDDFIKKANKDAAVIKKLEELRAESQPKVVIQAQRVEPQQLVKSIEPIVLLTWCLLL